MKKILYISVLVLLAVSCKGPVSPQYNVLDFGACADGVTDCTEAFNNAIAECSETGGVVIVPQGQYLCSTIHLKDNVELRLLKGSEILGSVDPDSYDSFIPRRDMSRYDSGDGTVNQNNSRDIRWNRALILANTCKNIAITGEGTINGRHVFDPLGEEYMRGPHTLVFGDCENVRLEGITITCAANYAFMGYALENASFRKLKISEGWDGIHIRGGIGVSISDCCFETGDDSVAGGYWTGFEMKNCHVNSSCNGVRMIMPSEGVNIHDCIFEGPGHYPHRTSGEQRRTNMLFGILFEPGGWGAAPGELGGLRVSDCTMLNTLSPLAVSVGKDNVAHDLVVSNVVARGTYGTLTPVVNYNDKGFESITLKNVIVER